MSLSRIFSVYISFICSLFLINSTSYSQEHFCEICVELGGFYCGDDPSNWTSYSPNGCVPDYYINDGYDDCLDGSDENGADATTDCVGSTVECIDESVISPDMTCNDMWTPVCGCDGITYSNDCYAYYYHGVTEWEDGPCEDVPDPDDIPSNNLPCDAITVFCGDQVAGTTINSTSSEGLIQSGCVVLSQKLMLFGIRMRVLLSERLLFLHVVAALVLILKLLFMNPLN